MDTCFPDDQKLAQMIEDKFNACDKGLQNLCQSRTVAASERFNDKVKACKNNKAVMNAVDTMEDKFEDFTEQNGWESKMDANYEKDKHSIDGFYLQSRNAWFAGGKYYESGNLAGLNISRICYDSNSAAIPYGLDKKF